MFPDYMYNPQSTAPLQGGGGVQLQGGSSGSSLQGSSPSLQGSSPKLQVTANPQDYSLNQGGATLGATTEVGPTVDPAAQAAAAKAAADAAKAAALRGEITNIANKIKDIFNSRYGQVEAAGTEQAGKLNQRFNTESGDVVQQVEQENQQLGAAHAAGGSFDSSYRGNNVDTVTKGGENQIRDLGVELKDNLGLIAQWVKSQQTGFDAQKGGLDQIVSRLGESTDPAELTQIRNQLDGRIAELNAGGADNNTMSQNKATLDKIAPSSTRAQTLKTTLSQIVAGNADASQKSAIGQRLIQNAGLTPQEEQALLTGFQSDLTKLTPTA